MFEVVIRNCVLLCLLNKINLSPRDASEVDPPSSPTIQSPSPPDVETPKGIIF